MAQHPLHHGIIWKLADLNRQGLEWCDVVANARVHGTTHRVPWEMLAEERPHLGKLPDRATLAPYLREDRKVSRDGFVSWEGSLYGVHWKWVGAKVQVGERQGTVEIWAGDERIAVHPRAQQPKERFICPASTIFAGWRQSVLPVHLLGLAPLLGSVGPVAGDVKLQDDGVVHDPVNRRGGGHGVGKDALPLREDQV